MRWLLLSLLLKVQVVASLEDICTADAEHCSQASFLQKSLVLVSEPQHEPTSHPPSLKSEAWHTYVSATLPLPTWLCCGFLLVVFAALLLELLGLLVAPRLVAPLAAQGPPPQAVFLWMWASIFAASSVVMPPSFDFAIAMGHGPVLSGFLVSGGALAGAAGLLLGKACVDDAWDQPLARRLCVWSGLLASSIQLLEACVVQSALLDPQHSGLLMLLALRQGEAFTTSLALMPALAMQRRVAPAGFKMTASQCARLLGFAAGPVLLLLARVPKDGGLAQAFAAAAMISLTNAVLCSLVLPQAALPEAAAPPPIEELDIDAGSRQQLVRELSRFFWVRPFAAAAAEVATMMVLEVGFGWSAVMSGLSSSLASVGALAFTLFAAAAPSREPAVFLGFSVLSLLGCALAFDLKVCGVQGLLVGDVLLQASASPTVAIAERWAKQAAALNTAWSAESFHLAALLSSSCGRFVGPPLARGLLAAGGRNSYALMQLVLLTCAGYTVVRSCGLFWRSQDSSKASSRS